MGFLKREFKYLKGSRSGSDLVGRVSFSILADVANSSINGAIGLADSLLFVVEKTSYTVGSNKEGDNFNNVRKYLGLISNEVNDCFNGKTVADGYGYK